MKKFLKKGLVALTLMLSMTFVIPQLANASTANKPKGWTCRVEKDGSMVIEFEDGTIYTIDYGYGGEIAITVYDPETPNQTTTKFLHR